MRLSACITTVNATQELDACLQALWNSSIKPYSVIVSDDSLDSEIQQKNRQVVEQYPVTTYISGPRAGCCANRNCAVNAAPETELVCLIDDDICVAPDFIANAIDRYTQMLPEEREHTLITGGVGPHKISFRGYYMLSDTPQSINVHTSVFPRSFFKQEQWDEAIFFGYNEGELALRAMKKGYRILYCPELKGTNLRLDRSTFKIGGIGNLTEYDIHVEAARLYVGIKRYKNLDPNPFKLAAFLAIYFGHMTIYLLRQKALNAWPEIIRRSHFQQLL